MCIIHWFRHDLRLADNPALTEAAKAGPVLPIYIKEPHDMGSASLWWLHQALLDLNDRLHGHLHIAEGNALSVLRQWIARHKVTSVYWNRSYAPWRIHMDQQIQSALNAQGIQTQTYHADLLWEPWEIRKADQTPYKVFTPFYRATQQRTPRPPLPVPDALSCIRPETNGINAHFTTHSWHHKLSTHWRVNAADTLLTTFLSQSAHAYKKNRDYPALRGTSTLSPYLHYGQISAHQIWHQSQETPVEPFLRQLIWREFSYHLLHQFPDLPTHNLQPKFNTFPWQQNPEALSRWQQGMTGYPFVDAGMRQLYQTGYMHNRLRMVTASFLVKNLLIDWRAGAHWFWDCLVDADLANNSAGWQWVAGCGADAAPYFRIFNPIIQGKKFDPHGTYTRQYVPELAHLPTAYLFSPWEAPTEVLERAGIRLGEVYPLPIVDLKTSRDRALAAYHRLT